MLLLKSLQQFYMRKGNIEKIIPVIEGKSPISLRLLDWTVTNYARQHDTIITRRAPDNNIVHFNVYLSYRSQLKAYSKQQFDPFRRRNRIEYYYEPDKFVETTIGQLNFFRWVVQNDIMPFIAGNIRAIEADMLANKAPSKAAREERAASPSPEATRRSSRSPPPPSPAAGREGVAPPRKASPPPHAAGNNNRDKKKRGAPASRAPSSATASHQHVMHRTGRSFVRFD